MQLVSTLILAALADLEHSKTLRPSALIQAFYTVTLLLDLPRIRTQWLLIDNSTAASVFSATFVLRLIILQIESLQKWNHLGISGQKTAPEERQGIFGRTFFFWLMPMFFEGYKRDLSMADLPQIDDDILADKLYARLYKQWQRGR